MKPEEALAAGAVVAGRVSAPPPLVYDRPFIFLIRDSDGTVLGSGIVVDP